MAKPYPFTDVVTLFLPLGSSEMGFATARTVVHLGPFHLLLFVSPQHSSVREGLFRGFFRERGTWKEHKQRTIEKKDESKKGLLPVSSEKKEEERNGSCLKVSSVFSLL